MALIQVILLDLGGISNHDTGYYPVVLHFEDGNAVRDANWIIPSYPAFLPAAMLSEIRVEQGSLKLFIDGEDGFQSGPHEAAWVRGRYPRGKLCAFSEGGKVFSIDVEDGAVVIEEIKQQV